MASDDLSHLTVLPPEQTGGLGALTVEHPAGTFPPSPATRATLLAIAKSGQHLEGIGFDWGCGVGVLAVAAARLPGVRRVIGLDISPANVEASRQNAVRNGVETRTRFYVSDSFQPATDEGRRTVRRLVGRGDFLVANPPASPTGDGFDFRRRVLADARAFLRAGAVVLLQALSAYGSRRMRDLVTDPGGYAYEGIAHRTSLVPLDLDRRQMREQMTTYARAESVGALPYEFSTDRSGKSVVGAPRAAELAGRGRTLFARWQVHRFRRTV
jgi:SAM-dependent methyltransferase